MMTDARAEQYLDALVRTWERDPHPGVRAFVAALAPTQGACGVTQCRAYQAGRVTRRQGRLPQLAAEVPEPQIGPVCANCAGRGWLFLPRAHVRAVLCSTCDGRGRVPWR